MRTFNCVTRIQLKVSLSAYVNELLDVDLEFKKASFSFHLAFDGRYDLALDDFLLPLHCMFEKLQLTVDCQVQSIRLNWFFLWALKRPFELILSLASSLFPQTVSDPMRLQFEKREFISFRFFSSFQNPFH